MAKSKSPHTCELCGGPVLPVRFGLASAEMRERAARDGVTLGGCRVPSVRPTRQCRCGKTRWYGD